MTICGSVRLATFSLNTAVFQYKEYSLFFRALYFLEQDSAPTLPLIDQYADWYLLHHLFNNAKHS